MGKRTILNVTATDVEKRRTPSKHYVYVIHVTWSDGSTNTVYRRYSRFFDLQTDLLDKFPNEAGKDDPNNRIIPFLPGKKFFGRSHIREVAEKRLKPIDEYCQTLIKLPNEISESEEVLEFFEADSEDIEPIKERHFSKKPKGNKISAPKLLEQYVAVADYQPQGKGEIGLRQGMSIEVAEKTETGWWFVTAEDEQGWVPSTYLERQDGGEDYPTEKLEPGQEEEYVCTTAFTPDGPDEIGMEIGTIVLVVEKNLQGWWKIRLKGREGYVPAAYLSRVNPDKLASVPRPDNRLSGVQVVSSLSEVSEFFKPKSTLTAKKTPVKEPPPRTSSLPRGSGPVHVTKPVIRVKEYITVDDFHDNMGDGISFSAGQAVKVLEKSPSGWWYVEIEGSEGWAPAAYIQQVTDTAKENDNGRFSQPPEDDVFEDHIESDSDEDQYSDDDTPPPSNMSAIAGALKAKFSQGPEAPSSKPAVTQKRNSAASKLPPTPAKPPVTPAKPPATPAKPPATPAKPPATPAKPPTPGKPQISGKKSPDNTLTEKPAFKPLKRGGHKLSFVQPAVGETEEGCWDNNIPHSGHSPRNSTSEIPTNGKVNALADALKSRFEVSSNKSHNHIKQTTHAPDPPPKSNKPTLTTKQTRFRASAGFTPENSGEVSLQSGEEVTVIQADDSGWWLVKSGGVEGWAPATYLEEFEDSGSSSPVNKTTTTHGYRDNSPKSPLSPKPLNNNKVQSNSVADEINSIFGAKLKPVQKSAPSNFKGGMTSGNAPSTAILLPGKKSSAGSAPGLPMKPKPVLSSKGNLPPVPSNKPR